MQYDNYELKVKKLADFFKLLFRHMKKIIAAAAAMFLVAVILIAAKGTVSVQANTYPLELEYGEELQYSAEAFLGEVSYEYSLAGSDVWVKEFPKEPGNYYVRAVGEAAFGNRYGEKTSFIIKKKPVTVVVDSKEIKYGTEPAYHAELVAGDTLVEASFLYNEKRNKVEVDPQSVKIVDENNQDVTSRYEILSVAFDIVTQPRDILVSLTDASKVYDGTPLTGSQYEIATEDLAYQDKESVVFTEALVEVGEKQNLAEVSIFSADGKNVTEFYNISLETGLLTVSKRELKLVTGNATVVYGEASTAATDFQVSGTHGLAEGHTVSATTPTTFPDVGVGLNQIDYCILDAEGSDVTSNYAVICLWGSLTVENRPITLKTESYRAVYDGNQHACKEFSVLGEYGLAANHTVVMSDWRLARDVTEEDGVANYASYRIKDADGRDVTENYEVSCDFGKIQIEKRQISVKSGSEEVVYDGKDHANTQLVVEGELGLVEGHYFWGASADSFVQVGEYDNEVLVSILDENGNDVSYNYDFSWIYGKIIIVPRPICINTASAEFAYDGTEHSCVDYTADDMVYGHRLVVTKSAQITMLGETENLFEEYSILSQDGVDVTANYTVSFENGTLSVIRRSVILQTASATKVYDTTPLTAYGWLVSENSAYSLLEGHTAVGDSIYGSQTEEGSSLNFFSGEVLIYDENGNDVSGYYDIQTEYGTLTVIPRPITVSTNTVDVIYNGKAWFDDTLQDISDGNDSGLCNGHYFVVTGYSCYTNVIDGIYNTVSFEIYDADGESVTSNYEITYVYGEFRISPRPITVSTNTVDVIYNGSARYDRTLNDISEGNDSGLSDGHRFAVKSYSRYTDVIDGIFNTVSFEIYDADGVSVTSNYEITYVYGTFRISPRPITVSSNAISAIYDGTVWQDPAVRDISTGANSGLCRTHTFALAYCPAFQNVITGGVNDVIITIYDNKNNDVTSNYTITYVYGEVNIAKRAVTVQTGSQSWVYDGEKHTNETYSCVKNTSFVGFHSVDVNAATRTFITNVSTLPNQFVLVVYDEDGEDVTENYDIQMLYGSLSVTPRSIRIQSDSDKKMYDGTPLEVHSFSLAGNSPYQLVKNHSIIADFTGTITNVGVTDNTYLANSVIVLDQNGNDVTANYSIQRLYGTLEITRRPIKVQSSSAEKMYDGTPLEAHSFVIAKGSPNQLVKNHSVVATFTGSITEVGSVANSYVVNSVRIYDEKNNDVTGNYNITSYLQGELTVRSKDEDYNFSRPDPDQNTLLFVVTSDTSGTVYLKTRSWGAYTGNGWKSAPEYDSLTFDFVSAYYLTSFALEANGIPLSQISILSKTGEYVIPYYTTSDFGELQLSDVYVTGDASEEYVLYYFDWNYEAGLSVHEALKEFEREYAQFVRENYLDIDAETLAFMQNIITAKGFRADDPEIIQKVAKYIQQAATYSLYYDSTLDESDNVVVAFLSTYKEGVCQHYAAAATMLYRALGIPARYTVGYMIDVEAEVTTEYRGLGHAWVEVYIDGLGWVQVEVTGSSNAPGDNPGDNPGNNPGGNGSISKDPQTLTIKPINLDKDYDGTPLYHNNQIEPSPQLDALLEAGYTYEVVVSGSQTSVGSSKCVVQSLTIWNKYGVDVTDYIAAEYNIVYKEGTLRVLGENVVGIYIYPKAKEYTSEVFSYNNNEYYVLSRPDGITVEISSIKISMADVGYITSSAVNEDIRSYISYKIYYKGVDVTDDYELVVRDFFGAETYNILEISERHITITTGSATKEYDGEHLTSDSFFVSHGLLAEGHVIEVQIVGKQLEQGSSDNTINQDSLIIRDKDGNNVSFNYVVGYILGKLTVT